MKKIIVTGVLIGIVGLLGLGQAAIDAQSVDGQGIEPTIQVEQASDTVEPSDDTVEAQDDAKQLPSEDVTEDEEVVTAQKEQGQTSTELEKEGSKTVSNTEVASGKKETSTNGGEDEAKASNTSSYIPSGGSVYLKGSSFPFNAPTKAAFGDWYDDAVNVYNAILNKQDTAVISYTVTGTDCTEPYYEFDKLFEGKVLLNKAKITPVSGVMIGGTFAEVTVDISNVYVANEKEIAIYNANISAGLYNGMSQKDAVTAINRWICNNITYLRGQNDIYTALDTGQGNCDAYTKLFMAMCTDVGINCERVVGYTEDGGSHAWNRVQIGDSWYYIDVCWNDTPNNGYFLSETLWSDHII